MLTDIEVRNLKPREKPYKVSDGGGLHVLINPNGNKLWRFSYRFRDMQKTMAMGQYPHTGLADAREKRDSEEAIGAMHRSVGRTQKRKAAGGER